MELHWWLWPWSTLRFRIWATWSHAQMSKHGAVKPYQLFLHFGLNASCSILPFCFTFESQTARAKAWPITATVILRGSLIHSANLCDMSDMSEAKFVTSSFLASSWTQAVRRKTYRCSLILLVSPNKNSGLSQLGTGIEHHWTTNPKNKASIHPVLCASMHDSKSEFKTQTIPSTNQPYLVIEVDGTTEISKEGCHPYQKKDILGIGTTYLKPFSRFPPFNSIPVGSREEWDVLAQTPS